MKSIYTFILACFLLQLPATAQSLKGLFTNALMDDSSKEEEIDSVRVIIYADGNVRGLLTEDNKSTTSLNGAIGLRIQGARQLWDISLNLVSDIDTLESGFGAVVLNPANGRKILSGLVDYYSIEEWLGKDFGFHFYASASSSRWAFTENMEQKTKSATVAGLGALIRKDLIKTALLKRPLAGSLEFGVTGRGIFGNISNNKEYINLAIGSKGNLFLGLEGGMNIVYDNITFGLHGYWLFDVKHKQRIDDITSFQITGGVSISSALYSDAYKKN